MLPNQGWQGLQSVKTQIRQLYIKLTVPPIKSSWTAKASGSANHSEAAQQVTTDYHIDRLAVGLTPSKKRKTRNHELYAICLDLSDYSILYYMFAIAGYFGHYIYNML